MDHIRELPKGRYGRQNEINKPKPLSLEEMDRMAAEWEWDQILRNTRLARPDICVIYFDDNHKPYRVEYKIIDNI